MLRQYVGVFGINTLARQALSANANLRKRGVFREPAPDGEKVVRLLRDVHAVPEHQGMRQRCQHEAA